MQATTSEEPDLYKDLWLFAGAIQLIAASLLIADYNIPMAGMAAHVCHAGIIILAVFSAGTLVFWMRKRPTPIPPVLYLPSGWGAGRPLLIVFWAIVAVSYVVGKGPDLWMLLKH